MEFLNLGSDGPGKLMDKGLEIELTLPPGKRVPLPLLLDSAFQGGAPAPALMEMWQKLWPDSWPGVFVFALVLAELDIRLRAKRVREAIAEASCRN
jgi:hypothetical protein